MLVRFFNVEEFLGELAMDVHANKVHDRLVRVTTTKLRQKDNPLMGLFVVAAYHNPDCVTELLFFVGNLKDEPGSNGENLRSAHDVASLIKAKVQAFGLDLRAGQFIEM